MNLAISVKPLLLHGINSISFLLTVLAFRLSAAGIGRLVVDLGQVDVMALHSMLRAQWRLRLPCLRREIASFVVVGHATFLAEAQADLGYRYYSIIDIRLRALIHMMLLSAHGHMVQTLLTRKAGCVMVSCSHRHRILVVKHAHLSCCSMLLVFWRVAGLDRVLTIMVLSIVVVLGRALWPVVECHSLDGKRRLTHRLVAAPLRETVYTLHILLRKIFGRVEGCLVDLGDRGTLLDLIYARLLHCDGLLQPIISLGRFVAWRLCDDYRRSFIHVVAVLRRLSIALVRILPVLAARRPRRIFRCLQLYWHDDLSPYIYSLFVFTL